MEMVIYKEGASIFSEEELKGIGNIEKGPNYIEVKCVLKSQDHGELPGRLKVSSEGKLEINCECFSDCGEEKLSPKSFLAHNERRQINNWKNQICVIQENDKRVPLRKTPLLKYYYKHKPEEAEGVLRPPHAVHRDEFLCCSLCGKERRFRLRTAVDCRAYHDASANAHHWTCSQNPQEKFKDCLCRACLDFIQNMGD
ncbi:ultrapetala [Sarracenia purpurea var. burkii]